LAIGDMNKSLGESYEGTAAIVATTRRNMNVTPWVTGSSAEHVKKKFSASKLGNFGLFGSLCSMSLRFPRREMKAGCCKGESLQFCSLVGLLVSGKFPS